MKDTRTLDFCVIGAQKSGTTSLHYYLTKHPGIELPAEKEAPFFSNKVDLAKGMDWYIREFFPKASDEKLLGTVTPQYMAYPGTAEIMWKHCPKLKVIAILRDPVDRARSHYMMRVRAFGEQRSFQQAILEQLDSKNLDHARDNPSPSNSFVVWGEYGRILSEFLSYYPREKMLVTFQSDLEKEPNNVVNSIYQFLDLEPLETDEFSKRYNIARHDNRVSFSIFFANAIQNKILRQVGKKLIPVRFKRRLTFWSIINRDITKVNGNIDVSLTDEVLAKLSQHFLVDLNMLEVNGVEQVPWREKLERECSIGVDQ
jgi:hypothetical protein